MRPPCPIAHGRNFERPRAEERGEVLRRLRRDMKDRGRSPDVVTRDENSVRPMQFVEPSTRGADMMIPEGGRDRVAFDLLVTKMASIPAEA